MEVHYLVSPFSNIKFYFVEDALVGEVCEVWQISRVNCGAETPGVSRPHHAHHGSEDKIIQMINSQELEDLQDNIWPFLISPIPKVYKNVQKTIAYRNVKDQQRSVPPRSAPKLNLSRSSDRLGVQCIANQQGNNLFDMVLDRARKVPPIKIVLKQPSDRRNIQRKKKRQQAKKNFQMGKMHPSSLMKLSKQKRQRVNPKKQTNCLRKKKHRQKRGPPYLPVILSQKDLFGKMNKNTKNDQKRKILISSLQFEKKLRQYKQKKMQNLKQIIEDLSLNESTSNRQSYSKEQAKQKMQKYISNNQQLRIPKQSIYKSFTILDKKSVAQKQKIHNETNSSKIIGSQALKRRTATLSSQYHHEQSLARLKK